MKKFTRLLINAITLLAFLFFVNDSFAGEFAVSPMLIDMQGSPRESKEFSFTLFGKSNTNVRISFFDMNQLETGYMGFVESSVDNTEFIANWIELDNDRYRLREDESVQVNGIINIPARAAGSHQVAIMIEEEVPEEERGGISVKVRYAVVLTLSIDGRTKGRIQTSFEELTLVELEDGTYMEGYFQNNSATDEWLFSEVQLRGEDKRLLERVQLKTQSAWQRADAGSRVFPGARVRVYGKVTKPIVGGEYNIMVRNEFAGKSQPVYRDVFSLKSRLPGEEFDPLAAEQIAKVPAGEVSINPDAVEVAIRNNGTSFSTFYIVNNKAEAVAIDFPASMDNIDGLGVKSFQFYPANVQLQPGMRSRVVLRQNHLSDQNYGNIRFQAEMKAGAENTVLEIPTIAGL